MLLKILEVEAVPRLPRGCVPGCTTLPYRTDLKASNIGFLQM